MKFFTKNFLIAAAAILLKNIYCFISDHSNTGSWGVNRTLSWLWGIVFESYASVFVLICLFMAIISAIRKENRLVFYFMAISLFIFPFHSLYLSYHRILTESFGLPIPSASTAQQKMNWLAIHLSFLCYLLFSIIFLITAFINKRKENPGTNAYKIILGIFLAATAYCLITERTIWEAMQVRNGGSNLISIYARGVIFGGAAVWLITLMNFIRRSADQGKFFDYLFCVAVAMNILLSILFYKYLPEEYRVGMRLLIGISQLISVLQLFLYRRYPQKLITAILPLIPFIIGIFMISLHVASGLYVDFMPNLRFLLHDSNEMIFPFAALLAAPFLFLIQGRTKQPEREQQS